MSDVHNGMAIDNEADYKRANHASIAAPPLNQKAFTQVVSQLGVSAGMFYHGKLCSLSQFDASDGLAHIHLVRDGELVITHKQHDTIHITTPSVIFYPQSLTHQINTQVSDGAHLTCAEVRYDIAQNNLLLNSFDPVMVFELAQWPFLLSLIELIEQEQRDPHVGSDIICDQLMTVFVVYVLRHGCEHNRHNNGLIALLAHQQFSHLVELIFADIAHGWQLEAMAQACFMSRAGFAKQFKTVSGLTPNEFLAQIRLQSAMQQLQKGVSIQVAASDIGYSSVSALNKLFSKYVGMSPKAWLQSTRAA